MDCPIHVVNDHIDIVDYMTYTSFYGLTQLVYYSPNKQLCAPICICMCVCMYICTVCTVE